MINVFVVRNNVDPVRRLLRSAPQFGRVLRPVRYDRLFARAETPPGACVFTDFDLLSAFEVDVAARAARAAAAAGATVLNWPHLATERFALLRRLGALGLNPVEATRLDEGATPGRFPVFIRCEDGAAGPDTELLPDRAAFSAAVAALRAAGKTLKRRIAVSFDAEPDAAGFFRKYGAFVIGDHVVPQHLLRSRHWNVKLESHVDGGRLCAEEYAYVRDNPHAQDLLRIARVCDIDYGRIDYTIRDGRIVVFEINTNPHFPDFSRSADPRAARLPMVRDGLLAAFEAVAAAGVGRRASFQATEEPGRGNAAIRRAHPLEDLPGSLLCGRRWSALFARLRHGAPAHR